MTEQHCTNESPWVGSTLGRIAGYPVDIVIVRSKFHRKEWLLLVVTCWNVSLHVTSRYIVSRSPLIPLDVGVHQEDKTICDNKVVTSYLGSVKRRWDMVRLCRQPRWRYQQHEAIMVYLVDFSWEVVGSGWFSLTLRCWVKPPDDKLTVHGVPLVHLGTFWYMFSCSSHSERCERCFHPTEALYRFELCPEELAGAATGRLVLQFSDRSKEIL